MTLVYFCTLTPPPNPSPHLPPPMLTLPHQSLSVNLSVCGKGGVVAPSKPPPPQNTVELLHMPPQNNDSGLAVKCYYASGLIPLVSISVRHFYCCAAYIGIGGKRIENEPRH
jgi:hypothetical protein